MTSSQRLEKHQTASIGGIWKAHIYSLCMASLSAWIGDIQERMYDVVTQEPNRSHMQYFVTLWGQTNTF